MVRAYPRGRKGKKKREKGNKTEGRIEIRRYVPEGCWPESEKVFTSSSSSRHCTETRQMSRSKFSSPKARRLTEGGDCKTKTIKINWKLIDLPGEEYGEVDKAELIRRQWDLVSKRGQESLFFNVPLDQVKRAEKLIRDSCGIFPASKVDKLTEDSKNGKLRLSP